MTTSTETKLIDSAFSKAQLEMKNAEFDSVNPFFNNSKYASLASIKDASYPVFNKHGISIQFMPTLDEQGRDIMITRVCHDSGQWYMFSTALKTSKADMQQLGAASTYCKRMVLSALSGVVGDSDDDGNSVSKDQLKPKDRTDFTQSSKPLFIENKADLGETRIMFSKKYFNKTFKEIGAKDLMQFLIWCVDENTKAKKQTQPEMLQLIKLAEQFSKLKV